MLPRLSGVETMFMNHAKKILNSTGLTCSAMLMFSFSAVAAGAPDAGAVQQQFEQTLKQPTPVAAPAAKAVNAPALADAGTRVVVSAFEFVGNRLIPTATLQAATQGFLNKALTLAELRAASDAVQQLYREAGWMVRVFLPAQEIDNGQIKIEIVEAQLGKVVQTGEAVRVQASVIQNMVGHQLRANEAVPQAKLERALLLLNDLPGISSSASFAQGEQPGQTDLIIQVEDKPQVNGSVGLDNMGSTATGTQRLLGSINVNGPLRHGDLLSMTALKTEGSHYARAAYSLAVGPDGWRLGAHASDMAYRSAGETSTLKGNASTYGLDWSYPLVRSQPKSLSLTGTWDQKSFHNEDGVSSGSDFRIRVGTVGLNASAQDAWAGGGINNLSAVWTLGQVSPNTQLLDASTQGQYSKWLLSLGRTQALTAGLSLNATVQMQRANKTLDSSEKLYLGGAYGVRAYPTSEGAANEGESLTLELSQRLQERWTVNGFYDWAHARNPQATEQAQRSFHLRGIGVSATWQATAQMQIKATAAHRMGDAPQSTSTYSANRLWLSANLSF